MKGGILTGHGHELTLTGERTLPGVVEENYWFRRHEVAYRAARDAVLANGRGGIVLDAGCGEGYGAHLLSPAASAAGPGGRVVAVDYDMATVGHVRATYPRLAVLRANLVALPLAGGGVDAVVCMQVIEHLWDQPGLLAECARVLRPGGVLVVSTPNRLTFSPGRDTPLNPFHTRELAAAELAGLLRDAGFGPVRMLGVHHGPRLRELDRRHGGSLVAAQIAGPAADWDPLLRADVASVTAEDFTVHGGEVDASLDLFAVAGRPG